jgi:4-hydroxybenzoate polyprenyltransferase
MSDRFLDRDTAKNPFIGDRPDLRTHAALVVLLTACVGALCLTAPWLVSVASGICLLSGLVYSVGPRLKRYPVIGTLMNVTHFAPLLWVGLASASALPGLWGLTAVFSCLILQSQLVHELEDRRDDADGGVVTTALWLGSRKVALVMVMLATLAAALTAVVAHHAAAAAAVAAVFGAAVPLAVLRGVSPGRVRMWHRWSAVVFGAVLCVWFKVA